MACAERAPISLPTWGHIGEIFLDISNADQPWSFPKLDRKAAYKNLPLNPDHSEAFISALRGPPDGLRYGFRPTTLLFGPVAAALRCNFPPDHRALENLAIGLPMVNYFDDIGSISKSSISEDALATFSDFCRISAVLLKGEKSGLGLHLEFLGLECQFPAHDNGMALTVDMAEEKKPPGLIA